MPQNLCFRQFVLNPVSGQLTRAGHVIHLQNQPARVLTILVRRQGELVSRAELRDALWGKATFVDFEQNLNFCNRQVRKALDDSATHPTFIETLPRRGYRFIAPVQHLGQAARPPVHDLPRKLEGRRALSLTLGLLFGVAATFAVEHRLTGTDLHDRTVQWLHGQLAPGDTR